MAFLVRIGKTQANAYSKSGTEGTDYIELPVSSTYKTTSTTLVDSARNTAGVVVASVIRAGIRKIEMTWKVIGIADYSKLAKFFNSNFFFYAYYFDQDDNGYATSQTAVRQFYVGDRVADALKNKQITTATVRSETVCKVQYIENFKLSFIEV